MKRFRWLIFGFCTGCNAILGNDGQLSEKPVNDTNDVSVHPTTALVSAGEVAKSSRYKMVFAVGQSSLTQGTGQTTKHSMDNGLICK